jgi:hypothetical protein
MVAPTAGEAAVTLARSSHGGARDSRVGWPKLDGGPDICLAAGYVSFFLDSIVWILAIFVEFRITFYFCVRIQCKDVKNFTWNLAILVNYEELSISLYPYSAY